MVQPNTRQEQHELETFVPDQKVFVGIGFTNYDSVWQVKEEPAGVRTV